jgi:hypothetical protein
MVMAGSVGQGVHVQLPDGHGSDSGRVQAGADGRVQTEVIDH